MKPLIKEIFIDLDDVLNTFTMYVLREMGCGVSPINYDEYNSDWGYDIVKAMNTLHRGEPDWSCDTFWGAIRRRMWAGVPKTYFCDELIETCANLVGKRNVCILTTPTTDPDCAAGKTEWIQEFLPEWIHRQYAMCPRKEFCAHPNALLIDDKESNLLAFTEGHRGGYGIICPRPWNQLHNVGPSGGYILSRLREDFAYPSPEYFKPSNDDSLPGQTYFPLDYLI